MKFKILFIISILIAVALAVMLHKIDDKHVINPKKAPPIETVKKASLSKKTHVLRHKKAAQKKLDYKIISPKKQWEKDAVEFSSNAKTPYKIAIVIDDLGLNQIQTKKTIALPAPINLSFLPYGDHLQDLADFGKKHNHEIMLHLPMEPLNTKANPGPNTLKTNMSEPTIQETLTHNLDQFTGYVAVNNHMGSKATLCSRTMHTVLTNLKQKELLFLDSKTTPNSICPDTASALDYPILSRDVFLDHVVQTQEIEAQIKRLENIAKQQKFAIGIGHPNQATLDVLNAWIPTLAKKGFELVPISFIMKEKMKQPHGTY